MVGHSGSGKSTTASLIPRFYDVQQGSIKIGSMDIREIPHADLMKMVAFVFQDPKLFKDTLLENIRAGRPSATRDEVLQAAHLAQCDDILKKFPDGIDTVVGSKGVYLSGGETQRIAIARAILKDAPIVVLDEATAYADPENEQQIQKAFEGLVKGKTVIMIAHRLSTIQDADLILVMKQGELVESGTHDALVKQGGEYAKMWGNYTKTTKWHIGIATGMEHVLQILESEQLDECYMHLEADMYVMAKVPKAGVVLIMNLFVAIAFVAFGELANLLLGSLIACSILAEIIRKWAGYKNYKGIVMSYILLSLSNIGSPLYVWVFSDYAISEASEEMSANYAEILSTLTSPWFMVLAIAATVVISIIVGVIAKKVYNKQFANAGIM